MTRLLVECTHVFQHPKVNSGIQRVVRNVINQLSENVDGAECIPVVMLKGKLYRVLKLGPLNTPFFEGLMAFGGRLERLAHRYCQLHQRLDKQCTSRWTRRALYVAYRLTTLSVFSVPLRLIDQVNQYQLPKRCSPLQHQPGDQLVLLDSSWHTDFFPFAEQLKREGVGIVSVVYDLIPLTHPQFYDTRLVQIFNEWFDWISQTADGYMAISSTVRDQVREELHRRVGPAKAETLWFDYFHLGSELDLSEATAAVEPRLARLFTTPEPVFLMVSTIEPRKNHDYLLDAFELAWTAGSKARLCIAGRVGWKCDALLDRVRKHPELNQRLFMFNDLSDTSLEHAYSHASALVFPSYVEGFGLPLVEAMQRGLPAMGSDIPVFREIGGEFMAYFDLAAPQSLVDLITHMENTGTFPAARKVSEWRWFGWHEASAQLIERVLRNLKRTPVAVERQHADCP
ncbi:lipopolysaccharide 1,6-galactosyltransferase [Pseudomonas sp. FW306-02-F02-AA]|uniref:Glycosyl transferase n=1 Tax=Pseudomonas fluorescens TaxID=294 RepID=A0A0N9WBE9_PSEFL|nr:MULTISPECIES: glycosyltransferase family 1 protein [Pseudomonas]ALI01437.1 glycosyl transferase [Pseudomonas fluorescens]PMZ05849.1 lipopolysaccharide 1,6-galactosyltransferase [Pseudomonas sp. FW306-02-F02-AB]PMZ11419.1 lipopolysaccharide 1,6-galactosyltransferase [Pseudomonas sp. FW306-02-H06C]PMZ17342.1 lipopolysaccharide 1,6-galactosyltransferase [Pseudomonas sp. FW306-02-F02-AA]PMZ23059.1 lipopolysaccharide 1,6-galactosyltransferase [Pseudomonas sp. FW306-02-F08-AA]